MIEITIPVKCPTINHLYGQRGFRKFLKKEAKVLREYIENRVHEQVNLPDRKALEGKKLKIEIEVHENWLTKEGKVKRKDVANREKFLVDSIFESLGLDDKFIYHHLMKKIQSKEEKSIIRLEVI